MHARLFRLLGLLLLLSLFPAERVLADERLRELPVFGPRGQREGIIRQNPSGGYDLYDEKSGRLGFGKEYPDGTIRFYGNDGRPLFQIRPDGRVIKER